MNPVLNLSKRLALVNLCLVFCLAVAVLWNTIELHNFDSQTCQRHDQVISVMKDNLTIAFNGRHHFNDPADRSIRKIVYREQIARLDAAFCKKSKGE